MSDYDPNAREKLLNLLRLPLGKQIGYEDFRMAVEEIYNFGLDHDSLTKQELEIFGRLFEAVARFSPFPDDRAAYPTIYSDEKQVDDEVDRARRALGLEPLPD